MLTWNIGKVRVTCIVEVETAIPYDAESPFLSEATPENLRLTPWLYPDFVNEQDQLLLAVQALLVEAPGLRLVVDTCFGNDKPRNVVSGAGADRRGQVPGRASPGFRGRSLRYDRACLWTQSQAERL